MAAVSDNNNRNGGAAMKVRGYDRIASNPMSRLILVSDHLLLFSVRSW